MNDEMVTPPPVAPPPSVVEGTPAESYLRGGLNVGNTFVPFYATSMSVRNAATYIDLPSDMPVHDDVPISIDELFQRELDEERVREEIVTYIERRDDLHFFNSLTVVIFPLREMSDGVKAVAESYSSDNARTPGRSQEGFRRVEIGPVLLLEQHGNPNFGLLTWNPDFARAVVLDGQHRLFAMKDILSSPSRTATELRDSHISVLFLILDERAGFKAAAGSVSRQTLFGMSRQIFTDLNQKAVSVPKVRLLLLADEDLVATSLRQILAPEVRRSEDQTVSERVSETGRLPLALVDWRSESARFDSTYYLTSVLALRPVVASILDIDLPSVGSDVAKVQAFIQRAEQRLNLDDAEGIDLDIVSDRLARCEEMEIPFEFTVREIRSMGIQFRRLYGERIVRPLTELEPYAKLIQMYEQAGVLASELEPWLSFDQHSRASLEAELEARNLRMPGPLLDDVRARAKSGSLAFQVVFQQASILVLNSMVDFAEVVAAEWDTEFTSAADFLSEAIARWNTVFPAALAVSGRESAFFGAGIRADGTIDYRKSRVSGITGFMAYGLLSPIEWYTTAIPQPAEVAEWVADCWKEIQKGKKADPMKALLSSHGAAWRRSVQELLVSQDKESSDELVAIKHGRDQMLRLVEAAHRND